MIVAIDFDDTYTRDPVAWDGVIATLQSSGHTVYCVTMRHSVARESNEVYEALLDTVDGFFFTGRKAKAAYMFQLGVNIDVWIDDNPRFVLIDASS